MAYFNIKIWSDALKRPVNFEMLIPNDIRREFFAPEQAAPKQPIRTLFLLHGYNGSAGLWIDEQLAEKYNIAVVMPNGENSFWLDGISTGHKFCTFVGEELPAYIRQTFNLASSAEDTCIMGLSMGGFGAIHTALAYPDNFGKLAALSSALIVHEVAGMREGNGNPVANYEYYRECFGDPEKLLGSDNDPEALIDKLLAEGKKLPGIFMACGTEDFLIENNREFHRFLESRNVPHEYLEGPGIHDMNFWREYGARSIEKMFG